MNRISPQKLSGALFQYPAMMRLTTACNTSSPLLSEPGLAGFLPFAEPAPFFPLCDMAERRGESPNSLLIPKDWSEKSDVREVGGRNEASCDTGKLPMTQKKAGLFVAGHKLLTAVALVWRRCAFGEA